MESNIACKQLIWGRGLDEFYERWAPKREKGFEVVIGSDIIYSNDMVEPLFQTVSRLLSNETGSIHVFLLAYARRNANINLVLKCAQQHGLEWKEPKDEAAEGIYIYILS